MVRIEKKNIAGEIGGCHEKAHANSFETSPHLILLALSLQILMVQGCRWLTEKCVRERVISVLVLVVSPSCTHFSVNHLQGYYGPMVLSREKQIAYMP